MKPKSLPLQKNSADLNTSTRITQMPSAGLILRVGAILVLAGLLASGLYWSSSAAAHKNVSSTQKTAVVGDKVTSPLALAELSSPLTTSAGNYASWLTPPQAPPPITVTTYAGDCTTPKSVFNLQASEFSVCAKATGFQPGWVVIWSNAKFIEVQNAPVGSGTSTFTLAPGSSLGDWRVILYEPFGGSVYGVTPFTVVDNGNPSADLTVYKTTSDNSVAAGSQAVLAVQVSNLGPSDAATVEVSESVPANTTFASIGVAPGFNCAVPDVGQTGDIICTAPSMARGETAVFLIGYEVIAGTATDTVISATASISSATADPNADNNSSSVSFSVSGAASETCTLDCPANVIVTADTTSGGQPGAFVNFGAASGSGNCGAVTNNPPSGSFFTVGTHSITSSAELGGSCTFSVTVLDSNPPTISCPPNMTVTAPSGQTEAIVNVGTPTFSASGSGTVAFVRSDDTPAIYDDDGNLVTAAVIHDVDDPYPIGTTGILWTVTDAGGRKASCSQTITVLEADARDPVSITCPAAVNVQAPDGSCEATISAATIGTPTTNPSDSDVVVSAQRGDGQDLSDPFPAGTTQITWTAHDNITNTSASCVQNVTVTVSSSDTTPPTFVAPLPPNLSVTTSTCTATLDDELGTAEATDGGACGGSVTITRTGVPANFVFPTGTTTVIYTATDASGNTAQHLQLVTVSESPAIPPSVTAPPNVSVNTGAGATICGTVVSNATLGNATASDNCPGVTVVRTGVPAGNLFPVGNTTVTYTATDASGNTAFANQTVTVVDNTLPIVTPPAAVTLYTGAGATTCSVTVSNLDSTLGTGSATDNCPGVGAVTRSGVPAGSVFPLGNTVVTYSATDAHGNTGTATQTVTVVDNTPPLITCSANIIADFNPAVNGAVVTYVTPVGTDNCSATTTQIAGLPSGATFPVGTTTNTFRVTDGAGNTAQCSFNVTVAITSVIGLDSASLSGNALVDSYDSTGGYPATKGSLANFLSNGVVSEAGSSKMFGNVRSTRVGVSVLGTSQVNGNATAGTTVTKAASAIITGTITNNALAPVMTLPSVVACGPPYSTNSGISGTYSYNSSTGNLSLSGNNIATLANGTYCFNNVTLTNSAQLKVNGLVTIKLTGTFNAGGASTVNNTTQVPANLRILSSYSGSNGIVFSNGNSAYLLIYAPQTSVTNSGNAPLFGTLVGKTLTISNSGQLHYDTKLKTIWPDLWTLILAP